MKSQAVVLSILFFISTSAFSFQKIDEPKTIEEAVTEIKVIFSELGYPFKPNVTNEEIIFGLQHTLANQRQPESEKGKKFEPTPEYLSKIGKYYRNFANVISTNKSDNELIGVYVIILQDLTIIEKESSFSVLSEQEIQSRNNQKSRGYFIAENRRHHPTEVNTDPMLLAKEKDGMNEGLGFNIDGKELIFMKQYLASLLEIKSK